eukprot:9186862-Prorocentrum_lima.AAC.1
MTSSLVGSEMCIRDSLNSRRFCLTMSVYPCPPVPSTSGRRRVSNNSASTVSYTHLTLPTICSV